MATYLCVAGPFPGFPAPPGLYHLEALGALRTGPVALDLGNLPGLVTFPSFHTAAGIVLTWAFWRTRAFPVVAAYAATMIAATPVFGGHYFVDLLAGACVAAVVCGGLAALPFYRDLFPRRAEVGISSSVARRARAAARFVRIRG